MRAASVLICWRRNRLKIARYDPDEDPFAYQLKLTEILAAAAEHKASGNGNFAKKNFSSAHRQYAAALKKLGAAAGVEADVAACFERGDAPNAAELKTLTAECATLRSDCAANDAACHLRLKDYRGAVAACRIALASNAAHPKALFRLGCAYEKLEKFADARKALKRAAEADPKNEDIRVHLRAVKLILRDDLKDNFGALFKKDTYEKARVDLETARLAREKRDFEELRARYAFHIKEVLERCLKHSGGTYEEYADDVAALADAGARQADKKDKPLHESLKPAQKKLWRLFYVNARRFRDARNAFRITAEERASRVAARRQKKKDLPFFVPSASTAIF